MATFKLFCAFIFIFILFFTFSCKIFDEDEFYKVRVEIWRTNVQYIIYLVDVDINYNDDIYVTQCGSNHPTLDNAQNCMKEARYFEFKYNLKKGDHIEVWTEVCDNEQNADMGRHFNVNKVEIVIFVNGQIRDLAESGSNCFVSTNYTIR